MIGVVVTFDFDGDFDRSRVEKIAQNARSMFAGMPGFTAKFFSDEQYRHLAIVARFAVFRS
jgi:hypothetical protein